MMSVKRWEKKVLKEPGAVERVALLEQELRAATEERDKRADLELAEWDWVVLPSWGKLHHPAEFSDLCGESEGVTSCGRRGILVIPGIFTRMGAARCSRCCDKLGYPHGKGSPKNDDRCRPLVETRLGALGLTAASDE